jgi:uncharacterized protein DUF4145
MADQRPISWQNLAAVTSRSYVCGYCGDKVGPDRGYIGQWVPQGQNTGKTIFIFICSSCNRPTFFDQDESQWPGVSHGAQVQALPPEIDAVYGEVRRCMSVSAYTTAVMACRKLLMHIAVEKGADKNKTFKYYVDWLVKNHFVPPGGEGWVDQIRGKGNDANHEIDLVDEHSAEQVISFVELLLKFVYEMPARVGMTAAPAVEAEDDGQ